MNPANPLLVVLSAPSGGGKTTLCRQLLASRPNFVRAVTCTTRAPRPGEQDRVDYYFVDAATFQKRVAAGEFLEHATVFGRSYGTLRAEVLEKLRSGRDVVLSIDVQGAATVRERAQADAELRRSLVTVFLAPPSIRTLEERLTRRNQDAPDEIQRRLAVARQEIAQAGQFDYIIVSNTMAEDLRRMLAVVEAELLRAVRAPLPVYD